jgi:hypothetical protein
MNNVLIATGDITSVDDGMGVAVGTFSSLAAYESVRRVFEALSDKGVNSPEALYAERDSLRLELRDEESNVIPTRWIHIVDLRRAHDDEDAAEIDAALTSTVDVQRILKAISGKESS